MSVHLPSSLDYEPNRDCILELYFILEVESKNNLYKIIFSQSPVQNYEEEVQHHAEPRNQDYQPSQDVIQEQRDAQKKLEEYKMMEEHRKEEFLKEEQRKEEMRREERLEEQRKLEEKRIDEIRKVDEEEFRKETDSPRRSITPNAANGKLILYCFLYTGL